MLTWYPTTKEQGIAGSEAPRPTGRNPILLQRRGARRRKNKVLRGAKHHDQPAEAPFALKDVVPVDERIRRCGERSTTPNRLKSDFAPKTWCPATKEQGIAGSEAPRPTGRSPILSQRRGARRRKNKVLRGVKHHVQPAEIRFCSEDVVTVDERTRHCGERSTTPNRPKPHFVPKTWCPTTEEQGFAGSEAPRPTGRNPILLRRRGARRRKNKALRGAKHHVQPAESDFAPKTWCPATEEQGFAGSEAPRPTGRSPILSQRRGARRRKNKALGGAKHHAQPAEAPFCSKDVVPGDERTRHCGERSTTPNPPNPHLVPKTWCPVTKNKILQTTLSRY